MPGSVLAVAACGGMVAAQDLPPPSSAGDAARSAIQRGDYMAAHKVLATAIAAAGPNGTDDYTMQMWRQTIPMLTGELPLDGLATDHLPAVPDQASAERVKGATARSAIAEIVRRARATSIVILNEPHYSPRDRAFALGVARALRPLGYRYLAAEAFSPGPEPGPSPAIARLIADRAVTRYTGYYTHDPVFAGYINEALRLGYEPVVYESTQAQNARGSGMQPREDGEAENLQAFLQQHPGAKLLVHVGHGHVNETPVSGADGPKTYPMAARLKQVTGIDPLTISQTALTDLQPSLRGAYQIAAAKAGRQDVVLFDGNLPLLLGQAGADLQVVHPARAYRYGRPTWLAALGGRPVVIPPAILPTGGERLIQAFDAGGPADAVPLDQVLVTAGRPVPKLMLPPGVRVRYATQP